MNLSSKFVQDEVLGVNEFQGIGSHLNKRLPSQVKAKTCSEGPIKKFQLPWIGFFFALPYAISLQVGYYDYNIRV